MAKGPAKGKKQRRPTGWIGVVKKNGAALPGFYFKAVDPTTKRRVQRHGGDTVDAAKAALAKFLGETRPDAVTGLRARTLQTVIEEFLEHQDAEISPRHKAMLKAQLERFRDAPGHGEDAPIAAVTRQTVESYLAVLARKDGQPRVVKEATDDEDAVVVTPKMSPSARRHHLAALSGLFEFAVERKYLPANPARGVKVKKGQKYAPRFLTADEVERVLTHVPAAHRPLFEFLSQTGLRLGEAQDGRPAKERKENPNEVQGLTWLRVAPKFATITVAKSKSGEPRTVPMSARAREILGQLWTEHVAVTSGPDYVFAPHERSYVWRVWQRACITAGVGRGVRVHDLRHYVGSSLAQAGVPLSTVQKILGHSTAQMTELYASHVPNDATALAFAALDRARGVAAPAAVAS